MTDRVESQHKVKSCGSRITDSVLGWRLQRRDREDARTSCDVDADNALGAQDYLTAINLHRRLLRSDGKNALAHYHLGFAYGMLGQVSEEIREYRKAIGLGLNTWDLFMNLGLAYYDRRELANATSVLETAVAIGPGLPMLVCRALLVDDSAKAEHQYRCIC